MRLRLLLVLSALVMLLPQSPAWVQSTGNATWPVGATVTMQLRLGVSPALLDGRTWDANAIDAMEIWNRYMRDVQFAWQATGTTTAASHNGLNDMLFADDMSGEAWGANTLALTRTWYSGTTRTESDILFNRSKTWDAYRGALRYPGGTGYPTAEFRRVAMHELGHVLGLGHPDEAGQSGGGLMNSTMSDVETLLNDDMGGIAELYGAGPATPLPNIWMQPVGLSIHEGNSVEFWISADGPPNLRYQWYKEATAIAGATAQKYSIAAVQRSDAGLYRVTVTNKAGTATSNPAELKVIVPDLPRILQTPVARTLNENDIIVWDVSVTGAVTITWRRGAVVVQQGASSSFYKFPATLEDAGSYTVEASNSSGSVTSAPFTLTVNPIEPPRMRGSPGSQRIYPESQLHIRIDVADAPSYGIVWNRNGEQVPIASLSPFKPEYAGTYTAVAYNPAGTATSAEFRLNLIPDPVGRIWVQPSDSDGVEGERLTLQVSAVSRCSYQWFKNGQAINGATDWMYTISQATLADRGSYTVVVTWNLTSATSRTAQVTVSAPPVRPEEAPPRFRMSPASRTFVPTETFKLGLDVVGATPMTIAWKKDGVILPTNGDYYFTCDHPTNADAGRYVVVATNRFGTTESGPADVTLAPAEPPMITLHPGARFLAAGEWLSLECAALGTPLLHYQWRKDGVPIGDANDNVIFLKLFQPADSGRYSVVVSNEFGSETSEEVEVRIVPPPAVPTITKQPGNTTGIVGGIAKLTVAASGRPRVRYQWRKNGSEIPGAISPTLELGPLSNADAGRFDVIVYNSVGSVPSQTAALAVVTSYARLINLSTRARVGTGADVLIPGFVIGGDTPKRLLIRAVGPSLEPYGISDYLPDPTLELKTLAGTLVTTNDNWTAADAAVMQQAGAFSLPASSKDAAMVVSLPPGMYTAVVSDKAGRPGVGLVELYDLEPGVGKLINISTRARVGTGADVLIPGLVVDGNASKRLLIRAAGPALQPYGISDYLADPQMEIKTLAGVSVMTNDNWNSSDTALQAAFTTAGAFAFTTGSKDAALLIDLAPGLYTVVVKGVGDTSGVALVEVYEMP